MSAKYNLDFQTWQIKDDRWCIRIIEDRINGHKITVEHIGLGVGFKDLPVRVFDTHMGQSIAALCAGDITHFSAAKIKAERFIQVYGYGWIEWSVLDKDTKAWIVVRNCGRAGIGWAKTKGDHLRVFLGVKAA
jgi:hypothetical protein